MTIYNIGSINIDLFYDVPRLPRPGETLAATAHSTGLGGKGANQSIAAAQGGAHVVHVGAVGPDGDAALAQLAAAGVDTRAVERLDIPTGHAIVTVDAEGENAIVIFSSANRALDEAQVSAALADAQEGDFCLLQNETNLVPFAAELAQDKGMRVVYSAAPFDAQAAQEVLPFVDLLAVNTVEAGELARALGVAMPRLPVPEVLITRGAAGAVHRSGAGEITVPAFVAEPVDTTGAGDTYLGFFIAGRDAGMNAQGAMKFAAAAAALQVTRPGTATAIPTLAEVHDFLQIRLAG